MDQIKNAYKNILLLKLHSERTSCYTRRKIRKNLILFDKTLIFRGSRGNQLMQLTVHNDTNSKLGFSSLIAFQSRLQVDFTSKE